MGSWNDDDDNDDNNNNNNNGNNNMTDFSFFKRKDLSDIIQALCRT